MESRNSGRVSIIYGTWNPAWPDMKVLNTETQKGRLYQHSLFIFYLSSAHVVLFLF